MFNSSKKTKKLEQRIELLEENIKILQSEIQKLSSTASISKIESEYGDLSLPVKLGPMNSPVDKHPDTIIASCYYLKMPLPSNAKCGYQPSHYIGEKAWPRNFDTAYGLVRDITDIGREDLEKAWKDFLRRYKPQKNLKYTATDAIVYFYDWIRFAKPRGFSHHDYFDYELYNKEPDVRDSFLNDGYRSRIYVCCNKLSAAKVMRNKASFNTKFKKWVNRDWIDGSVCTIEQLREFVEKHEAFFAKPVCGTGGYGARAIKREEYTADQLFTICQEEKLILEEIIRQHPSLREFNESTLNTVRVNTLLCADGNVRVTLGLARFGRAGNDVDNFHGGGVGATIDVDTGMIISEAIDREHVRTSVHPDSGKRITGYLYPHWEEIKAAVCQAAKEIPALRHVGWDVSVTEAGAIEFVEGNCKPNFDALQSPDQIGRRFRYKTYIEQIEQLNDIPVSNLEPLVIDTSNMVL